MRSTVRKALNFVNHDDQKSFKNILDKFTKTSNIGHSVEILNAEFFQISAKIIKRFAFNS